MENNFRHELNIVVIKMLLFMDTVTVLIFCQAHNYA